MPKSEFGGEHANEEIRVLITSKFRNEISIRNTTRALIEIEDAVLSTVRRMKGLDGS